MHSIDWREVREAIRWAVLGTAIVAALVLALLAAMLRGASAHDWKRPDLDGWYGSLRNPHSSSSTIKSIGCCSKDDCHETQAEQRGADWWAKLGHRTHNKDDQIEWVLDSWAKVPAEAILEKQDNPTGSAVVCQENSLVYDRSGAGTRPNPDAKIWCFIRPIES